MSWASVSSRGRSIGVGAATQASPGGVRNRAFSTERRRTRASMTIRSPPTMALRHSSMAQAAWIRAPSLSRRRTPDWWKLSRPMLKTKEASASNWFWVSGAKTASLSAWETPIRS